MSDVGGPNLAIERKKVEVAKGQLVQNKLAAELRIMQIEDDRSKALDNLRAIETAIGEQDQKLAALDQPPPPEG